MTLSTKTINVFNFTVRLVASTIDEQQQLQKLQENQNLVARCVTFKHYVKFCV
jgi:hypothetical protein